MTLEDIEQAIARLPPEDVARLRLWLAQIAVPHPPPQAGRARRLSRSPRRRSSAALPGAHSLIFAGAFGRSDQVAGKAATSRHNFGNGRFDLTAEGTFTSASPSSTISSATLQMQVSRARWRSGTSSATVTVTSTWSPILTGARKFSVCEM